ncbi:MAG: hypothetical protein M3O23_03980 [Actinomycetota bacterium]|nr:hypothetical protein [Actinomycetota bacterium]
MLLGRSPFARLALAHGLAVAGDTLVTMALAGSLFFSISPGAARGRVALYLALTMAPFVLLAPLIGPALDRSRGGRRTMLVAAAASRAVVCFSMAGHLHSLWLFPEAFAVLVLSKAHMVTKSAIVPTTVSGEGQLVSANSRLAVLAVLAGFVAAVPGLALLKIEALGAPWVVRLAGVAFAATALAGLRLARPVKASPRAVEAGEAELHTASVRTAATAMAVLRAAVGFLTFFVAFAFRTSGAPSWWFGVVLAVSMASSFLAAAVAPFLRRHVAEERILQGGLALVAVVGVVAGRMDAGLASTSVLAAAVGLAAGAGKLAFDSIVQRDAPDAVRGRTFARFETRFQLVWVIGAAVPVVLRMPAGAGADLIALATGLAFAAYLAAARATASRGQPPAIMAVTEPEPSVRPDFGRRGRRRVG